MAVIPIEEPRSTPANPEGFALFALGFRPFYLLAAAFAALSVPLWALQYAGWIGRPWLQGPLWHAHEMLFGFALAVIVGFLFTAGRNWSGRPTPTGGALAALALLWLAARVAVLTPFGWLALALNVAFPVAAAIALARPFIAARSKRNYFFIAILAGFGVAAAVVHLAQLRVVDLPDWVGIRVGLDMVMFVIAVMAGRVVPMFTNNGVPGAGAVRHPWVEKAALGGVLALIAADLAGLQGPIAAVLLVAVAVAHATRLALWKPWRTGRNPLVWVLHAAYLWLPLHLLLRVGAEMQWLPASLAAHALTVGTIGGMTIGMMTRTARGHTGRPLRADRFEVAAYVAVLTAAVVRVAWPMVQPEATLHAVLCSALLWSIGFGIYTVRYWPILSRPRLDGQPG